MRATDRCKRYRQQIGVVRWRAVIVWTEKATGAESFETVGWSSETADEAMRTVAAYFPASWPPEKPGHHVAEVQVRRGKFVATQLRGRPDVMWVDTGDMHAGAPTFDGFVWFPVEVLTPERVRV